jgi:hypothetical protein
MPACARTLNHEEQRRLRAIARSSLLRTDLGSSTAGFEQAAMRFASGMKSFSGKVFAIYLGFDV